jgi:predicted hydrocarbon binding protein
LRNPLESVAPSGTLGTFAVVRQIPVARLRHLPPAFLKNFSFPYDTMSLRPNSDGRRQTRDESFIPQPAEGALRLPDGRRVTVLTASYFQFLTTELATSLDDQTRHALYKIGYEWALQDLVRLSRELAAEFGGGANLDLWQMDAKFVLDRWWAPLGAAGWGSCRFDLSALSRGFAFVELRHSVVAAHAAGSIHPACHLYAGLFAGAVSFLERIERHAVETQCTALGATECRFVVGPGPQIDEVESWRQQRILPEEIRRRLA